MQYKRLLQNFGSKFCKLPRSLVTCNVLVTSTSIELCMAWGRVQIGVRRRAVGPMKFDGFHEMA
jgi:hypothetical protein